MDKEQALNSFWNSFDIPAYDNHTVPTDEEMRNMGITPFPRITYDVTVNEFGTPTSLYGSIWAKDTGWGNITNIAHKIDSRLSEGGQMVSYDGGVLWIKKGNPFQQRMGDPDDTIRRIIINIEVEYLEGKR
jgi:hypothetical protein